MSDSVFIRMKPFVHHQRKSCPSILGAKGDFSILVHKPWNFGRSTPCTFIRVGVYFVEHPRLDPQMYVSAFNSK